MSLALARCLANPMCRKMLSYMARHAKCNEYGCRVYFASVCVDERWREYDCDVEVSCDESGLCGADVSL